MNGAHSNFAPAIQWDSIGPVLIIMLALLVIVPFSIWLNGRMKDRKRGRKRRR